VPDHPYIPVPNTVLVELVAVQEASYRVSTLWFRNSGGFDAADLTVLATQVRDWWHEGLRLLQSDTYIMEMIRVTDKRTETGAVVEFDDLLPIPGASVTDALPANATLSVKFSTALRGRSYRGRNFIPGLVDQRTSPSNLTSAYRIAIVDTFYTLPDFVEGEGWEHVVVSQFQAGAWLETAVVTTVTGYSADDSIDSQRRRLNGRGA